MDWLMRLTEVEKATSLSKTTIYEAIRAGTFPRPIRLSANRVAWSATEVPAWMADKSGGVAS